MRAQMIDIMTVVAYAVFGVAFLDVFVLGPFGARLLPFHYKTARTLTVVAGFCAGVAAIAVMRRRRASSPGFLSTKVPFHIVVVLLLAPVALASIVGYLGSLSWFLDLFAHFRLQYTAVLGLGVAILLLLRKPKWALLVGLFLLPNLAALVPYVSPWPRAATSGNGPSVRLALANLNTMNQNHDALKAFLFDIDADVIVLKEIDPVWLEAMTELHSALSTLGEGPAPKQFWHRALEPRCAAPELEPSPGCRCRGTPPVAGPASPERTQRIEHPVAPLHGISIQERPAGPGAGLSWPP